MLKFPLPAACALLAAVAVVVPAHADRPVYPPSYGSSGVFGVGTQTRDGLTAFIPPGLRRLAAPRHRSIIPICASLWCSPAAGVRLSSLAIGSALSSTASAATFSSRRSTRFVPGIGAQPDAPDVEVPQLDVLHAADVSRTTPTCRPAGPP